MKRVFRHTLVVLKQSFRSNFGVKAAEIADRKSIRIALIRMDLRSLAVDDLNALSRSKFHQKLCLRTTRNVGGLRTGGGLGLTF